MSTITQQPVPVFLKPIYACEHITIKQYNSSAEFEKDLLAFLKNNHVLHLSTSRNDTPRSTPLEYHVTESFTFFCISGGGGKFANLKSNKNVSFSIAEPYDSINDFFGTKGLQAWGRATVYSRKEHPSQFSRYMDILNIAAYLEKLGLDDMPKEFRYKIIEIIPAKIKYSNPRDGVFHVTWQR